MSGQARMGVNTVKT